MRAMILEGKVKTTKAKARAVVGDLDRLIKLVDDGSVSARRSALSILANDKEATELLFKKYQALAKDRKSGFTNLVQIPARRGDAAEMMQISWVQIAQDEVKTIKKSQK
jgi:large subunit ribosomal protein L17